nr:MAG TPA: regulatory protein/DNA complex-sensing repressor [Caudoviricetes sp.]
MWLTMQLSDALKRFRKAQKLTQKQAAQLAGVGERVYQSYEYGKVVPTITVLVALADALDVSLDYLVGRSDDPELH